MPAESPRAQSYIDRGWWTAERIIDRLGDVARQRPDAFAITTPQQRITYGLLWAQAKAMSNDLGDGVAQQVGLIAMANGPAWVRTHAAIGMRGWTPASIPSTTSVEHLAHAIRKANAAWLFVEPDGADRGAHAAKLSQTSVGVAVVADDGLAVVLDGVPTPPPASLAPDDAHIFFTSSTTGAPKAVVHSNDTLGAMHTLMAQRFDLDATTPIFMPSPFGHSVGGMHGVRMAQWLGAELITMSSWDVDVALELAATYRPTYTAAATPFLVDLVRAQSPASGAKLASIRWFLCGGAQVPPDLIRRARIELPHTIVTPLWGMTEGGVTTCVGTSTPEQFERTVGTPMPGLEVAVRSEAGVLARLGEGELVMRGPAVFNAYLDEAELTRECMLDDGWFRTGDLASIDVANYITITGRVKDIIIRGGVNISPVETENAIMSHPSVRDVCVIGWPDERLGERLCAVVSFAGPPVSFDSIIEHCTAEGLPRRQLPERLVSVEEFPRTAAGKIRRRTLRDELIRGIEQQRDIDDLSVRYRTWGSGPPVVLVHGLAEDGSSWQPVACDLQNHQVFAYDVRGHGHTSIGAADGTLRQLGNDLIGFLEKVTGPAPVVGFSMGGTVALWAARQRPDLVTHALVIGTSSVVGQRAAEFFRTRSAQVRDDMASFMRDFANDNASMIASDADPEPVYRQRLVAIGDGLGYINGAIAMAALSDAPLTPVLGDIAVHVDVIAGTNDAFCPPKASQMIVDGLRDRTLHSIDGAGHLAVVDRPQQLLDLLNELLAAPRGDNVQNERPAS